jgi:anaerobic selenocysteine-containing dehydrogenase
MNEQRISHRICPFCEACCDLELTISDGKVTRVRGDEADVFSRGYMCVPRAWRSKTSMKILTGCASR